MSDIFDFEELIADMLNIRDEDREDDALVETRFCETFGIEMDVGYEFALRLLPHTIPYESPLFKQRYHAFVSKSEPVALMKVRVRG